MSTALLIPFSRLLNTVRPGKRIFLLHLIFISVLSAGGTNTLKTAIADTADYYQDNYLRYEDFHYLPNVKTATLYKYGSDFSTPVIELNSNDKLKLSFDDLDTEAKNYYYTFVHCDALWRPSNLNQSEYIDGYTEDKISEYHYSFNVIQRYIHYNLVFPTDMVKPTKSGNYIIKVFADNDQNSLVLTKRFMIIDAKVGIDATVKKTLNLATRNNKQEINFTINHKTYPISNPFGDLKVVLQQNGRWDNCITNLKPLFIQENQLVYNYDEGNSFNGGNEFRFFDIRSLRFQTERIQGFEFDSLKQNHVYLLEDENRQYTRYSTYSDINGRNIVKIREGNNSEIEADYAFVHFRLPYPTPITDGNLYIFGSLSDWRTDKRTQLKYNYKHAAYEAALYLKQGYYNYQYVLLRDKQNVADETFIEGNHSETENEYSIYVYHRAMGGRYDQLIGIKQLNSLQGY